MMLQYVVFFDRPECSKSDMQCDISKLYTHFFDPGKQFFRKMQSCCRRSSTSLVLGIYGLISVFVLQLMCDVWRQRHFTELIEDFFKNTIIFKPDQTVSFFQHIQHLCM